MNIDKMNADMRYELVRLTRVLYNEGFTTKEVAAKLCVSESTIRSVKKYIDEVDNKMTE